MKIFGIEIFSKKVEIWIGQTWEIYPDNPFNTCEITVLNYRNGWVLYMYRGAYMTNSLEEARFRRIFTLKEGVQ